MPFNFKRYIDIKGDKMRKILTKFLLAMFSTSILTGCNISNIGNDNGNGWNNDDKNKMFEVLNGYIPYPGDVMSKYVFDGDYLNTTDLRDYSEKSINITFNVSNGTSWFSDYEKTLHNKNYQLFSDQNGGPKQFFNIYHNYNYGNNLIELRINYKKYDNDLETITITAATYAYGRITDGKADSKIATLYNETGNLPFYKDGLYLYKRNPISHFRDSHYNLDMHYIKWYFPKNKAYDVDNLLKNDSYSPRNPDDKYNYTYINATSDGTTQVLCQKSYEDIMQADGKSEYCQYSFIVEKYNSGFLSNILEQYLLYEIPGVSSVAACISYVSTIMLDSFYLYFESLDSTALQAAMQSDGWIINIPATTYIFLASKRIGYKSYYFHVEKSGQEFEAVFTMQ